jgi:hypothetical protein
MNQTLLDKCEFLENVVGNRIFEPTLNIFKNGILFNYKKVGTRFLREISSGGLIETQNKQIDLSIYNQQKLEMNLDDVNNIINYQFTEKYIIAPWHIYRNQSDNNCINQSLTNIINSYSGWTSDNLFLRSLNKQNYTELFFENENDRIFLIRDPFERILSGFTQIISGFLNAIQESPMEYILFKKMSGISEIDSTIELVRKNFFKPESSAEKIPEEIIVKIFKYILTYKWDLIFDDIHTEPYLLHFREIIYNIKDTSKIKVIDLSQLKSRKSMEFFCDLREDRIPVKMYSDVERYAESNKSIYNSLREQFLSNQFMIETFGRNYDPIAQYIRNETFIYTNLITSPYFINLED